MPHVIKSHEYHDQAFSFLCNLGIQPDMFGWTFCYPAKIPFPLTQRFRAMLQNGIDLSTVDVSYVSSRSWYSCNSLATISFTNEQKATISILLMNISCLFVGFRLSLMSIMIKLYLGRYFLNLFGLRGLFSLILGEDNGQHSST